MRTFLWRLALFGLFGVVFLEGGARVGGAALGIFSASRKPLPTCAPSPVELRTGADFRGHLEFDPVLRSRWRPGSVGVAPAILGNDPATIDPEQLVSLRANSAGWRDREREADKPAEAYRVALIGDSFPAGWRRPFEDTIPARLEARLNAVADRPVEVLNFSLDGYSPLEYDLLIANEIGRFEPDLAIVLIYPLNDIALSRADITIVDDDRLAYDPRVLSAIEAEFEAALDSPARDGSMTWRELRRAEAEGRVRSAGFAPDGTARFVVDPSAARQRLFKWDCTVGRMSRAYTWARVRLEHAASGTASVAMRVMNDEMGGEDAPEKGPVVFEDPPPGRMSEAWDWYGRVLAQMAEDARTIGVPLAIVVLPTTPQVYPAVFAEMRRVVNAGSRTHVGHYDPDLPNRFTRRVCVAESMSCWDLLDEFRRAAMDSGDQLFDSHDPASAEPVFSAGHYTPAGVDLLVALLEPRIARLIRE